MSDQEFLQALPAGFYGDVNKARTPNLSLDLEAFTNGQTLVMAKRQLVELIVTVQRDPKPSYNVDGQEVLWQEYLSSLYDNLTKVNLLLSIEEGPVEEETQAWT